MLFRSKGEMEVTRRRDRRRRKLLDDLKDRRGYSHLKEEALDRTVWRARFGRDFGPVVRLTTKITNYSIIFYHRYCMVSGIDIIVKLPCKEKNG